MLQESTPAFKELQEEANKRWPPAPSIRCLSALRSHAELDRVAVNFVEQHIQAERIDKNFGTFEGTYNEGARIEKIESGGIVATGANPHIGKKTRALARFVSRWLLTSFADVGAGAVSVGGNAYGVAAGSSSVVIGADPERCAKCGARKTPNKKFSADCGTAY